LIQIKAAAARVRTDGAEFEMAPRRSKEAFLTPVPNAAATTHLPFFVTAPGNTDVLFNVTLVIVVASIVLTGVIFLTIHSLPERMAHKSKKIQLDLIAVLCLLALLTHEHAFWFAALLLAFLDIPDFLTPFNRIATSVETLVGQDAGSRPADSSGAGGPDVAADLPGQNGKGATHA
jgi:multisubunit Na+/H+ antiporter MnhF subunit